MKTHTIRIEFNDDGQGSTPLPFVTDVNKNGRSLKENIAWTLDCLSEKELRLLKTVNIIHI